MSSRHDHDRDDEDKPGNPLHTVLLILAVMALGGLWVDIQNTRTGGSIDLRNRVTGARVAAAGEDPYFYKWTPGMSDRFYDPLDSPDSPVSTPTVTPALLTLFTPFNALPYRVTQWLWLVVEYGCLLGGFWLWARTRGHGRETVVAGAILTCLFCLTPHWRLHVDRGQSYVILAALFFLTQRLAASARPAAGGFAASLLMGFRPTNAILLGVPAARRSKREAAGMAAGLALAFAAPLAVLGSGVWASYFKAMDIRAHRYLEHVRDIPAKRVIEQVEGVPIECMVKTAFIPFADSSVYKMISFQLSPAWLLPGWAVLAGAAGLWMARRGLARGGGGGGAGFWWAVSAWLVIGDFLLPAYRYDYNNVLLLPLFLTGLSALEGRARTVWMALSSALLAAHFAGWTAVWLGWKAYIPVPGMLALGLACGVAVWTAFFQRSVERGVVSAA